MNAMRPRRVLRSSLLTIAAVLLFAIPPAQAGWREELGAFRIGVVSGFNPIGEKTGYDDLKQTMRGALGMPVEVFIARDFAALIDAQASGRIEYAVMSANAYAAAWTMCKCIEPLIAPVGQDGTTGFRLTLRMRAAPGRPVAEPVVLSGPNNALAFARLRDIVLERTAQAVGGGRVKLHVAASQEHAEDAWAKGEGDALLGWVPAIGESGDLVSHGDAKSPGATIWQSDVIANGPHTVRANLPAEAKETVLRAVTGLETGAPRVYDLIEPRRGGGFRKVTAQDYDALVSLAEGGAR
ncbi:MAG TPA: PhnD/SsuA/transferrin family substrate-binding protein [Rhizobiaceae bacterium]|nr:PhnD/SsuA/transferrin family substrate-binding protein [Rhizobiaceae bacterium]